MPFLPPNQQRQSTEGIIQLKNNDTKDYSEQLEFLNSEPYYACKKIVNQSPDFSVRRTGSYRHKKSTDCTQRHQ